MGAPSGENMQPHVFTVYTGQLIQLLSNVKFKTDVMDVEEGEAYSFSVWLVWYSDTSE